MFCDDYAARRFLTRMSMEDRVAELGLGERDIISRYAVGAKVHDIDDDGIDKVITFVDDSSAALIDSRWEYIGRVEFT